MPGPPLDRQTVLVVDDTATNIEILAGILSDDYRVQVALNGPRALQLARGAQPPDLILLDVMMPEMDGYQVCAELKKDGATLKIPVIFVTALTATEDETRGFELGAVDYITKPVSPPVVRARVKTHLALYDQSRVLEEMVRMRTRELEDTRLEIIRRLGRAGEYKDNETGLHVMRMSYYCQLIAREAGMTDAEADLLLQAAPLHDVGKIGTPDCILRKPGRLDDEELAEMRRHPEIGAEIIGEHAADILKLARVVALTHHEKWDGTGYPAGIGGEAIPLVSRISALADVFDALTSVRPYKRAWSVEEAVALIDRESGAHFDPQVVAAFHRALPGILEVRARYAETFEPPAEPAG